jgi:hypothetical protein
MFGVAFPLSYWIRENSPSIRSQFLIVSVFTQYRNIIVSRFKVRMEVNLKKTTMLKLCIRVAIILTIAIFAVSFYNLFSFLSNIVTGETLNLNMVEDVSSEGFLLSLEANPRNNGFLDISVSIELKIIDLYDRVIAEDSASFIISAGSSHPLSLSLAIPASMVGDRGLQGNEGYMQMRLTVRTLYDLVGFTNVMKVGGGDQS